MNKYYSGIGSRSCPDSLRPLINKIAIRLEELGYILRSGGAKGADTFFEEKVVRKEIYLPKIDYSKPKLVQMNWYEPTIEAFVLAKEIHPNWSACNEYARQCHARNCHQVLGQHLESPSDFVVCYTVDGKASGGSATAINLALKNEIPVFNLFDAASALKGIADFLK